MKTSKNVIAIDLGAESGRVMRVNFDGEQLSMETCYRFPNTPVKVRDTLHWDVLRLWHEIQDGLAAAITPQSAALGLDTWGIDFALLDRVGNLLANPIHYRDARTTGMMEWVFERVPKRTIFERTGIQFMVINTLYQLASLQAQRSPLLDYASTFLTIPDLFNYWLTGAQVCEFSNATTTQCYNQQIGGWDLETLAALNIPTYIFPPIVPSGVKIGTWGNLPVIAPACHDTGSAVAAVPTQTRNYAYLSSGTWSLIGLELDAALINNASYAANVTNEGGVYGTTRLLKNVMGLWLAQQSRATWEAVGQSYSYAELAQMAEAAPPFSAMIDPDDPSFLEPGDMPARIAAFCNRTNQSSPNSVGGFMRVIYESLALKYRYVLETLGGLTGQPIDCLHIIGGGGQNALLNQMTADAIGLPVITGPVEATALGNALVQWVALGELRDLQQGRELLGRSFPTQTYEPNSTHQALYNEAYARFKALIQQESEQQA